VTFARKNPPTERRARRAAADWLARHDAGLDAAGEAEFRAWLAQDPRHAAAWEEMAALWRTLDAPRRAGAAPALVAELTARRVRRRRRRTIAASAGALAIAVALAITIVVHPSVPEPRAASDVVMVDPERRLLPDGSVIELKPGAAVDVHFSEHRRDVRLVRGEAHFAVAKDAARPFVVTSGATGVRAVGTAFSVGERVGGVAVLVTEGTVRVSRDTTADEQTLPVSAGHALHVPNSGAPVASLAVETVTPAEIDRRLSWRARRIELSGTPLAAVVAAFNRQNRLQLAVPDPAAAQLRLSGVFRADRPEDFVRLLEANYAIRADRQQPGVISLRSNR
jgi:transmembrane sensor